VTIPLFKSHYSIGRSILTLNPPSSNSSPEGPVSIFDIAEDHGLSKVVVVEDSFMGFLEGRKNASEAGIHFIFGLRFDVCQNVDAGPDSINECSHKIIVFPKNSNGCIDLNAIYTAAHTKHSGRLDLRLLSELWNEDNLRLAIPFYDSFIFKNLTSFNACVPNFSFTNPTFFIEDNGLPVDGMVRGAVELYCSSNDFKLEQTQSIYYKNKADFDAYLAYKLICGRNTFSNRSSSLEKPNLDHMGSNQFCWESYLDKYESA